MPTTAAGFSHWGSKAFMLIVIDYVSASCEQSGLELFFTNLATD